MPRLDVLLTGYEITDEIIERTSSTALALGHDTIRGTADLEIWTGAGGTGTQLALTTDYTVSDEDTDLSTEAGVSIYTKLAIVNGTYHDTPLYVSYKTIGDYANENNVRDIGIGYKEATGSITLEATDENVIVTTASATTLTIPEGLPVGKSFRISRTLASTAAVTVARSGADTVEGAATFITHGAFNASTLNSAEVVLKQVSAGVWLFVAGIVSGSEAGGTWEQRPNGKMYEEFKEAADRNCDEGTASTVFNYRRTAITFPRAFKADTVPSVVPLAYDTGTGVYWATMEGLPTNTGFMHQAIGSATGVYRLAYKAEGYWK